MANNIPAFQAEFLNLFTTTANLDTATKNELREAFAVKVYGPEWLAIVAAGTANTVNNRAIFATGKVIGYMTEVVKAARKIDQLAALPPIPEL
jgi:hypothetical protein